MVFFLGQSRSVFTVWRWKIAVCGGSLQRPTDSHHCHLRRPCYRHHPHHRTCHRDEEEEAGCVQEERLCCWVRQWSGPGEVQRTQPGRNHLWFWKQREQSKRQVFKYDIPDNLRTKKATFLKKKKDKHRWSFVHLNRCSFSEFQIIKSVMHQRVVRMGLLVYRRQMDPRWYWMSQHCWCYATKNCW